MLAQVEADRRLSDQLAASHLVRLRLSALNPVTVAQAVDASRLVFTLPRPERNDR